MNNKLTTTLIMLCFLMESTGINCLDSVTKTGENSLRPIAAKHITAAKGYLSQAGFDGPIRHKGEVEYEQYERIISTINMTYGTLGHREESPLKMLADAAYFACKYVEFDIEEPEDYPDFDPNMSEEDKEILINIADKIGFKGSKIEDLYKVSKASAVKDSEQLISQYGVLLEELIALDRQISEDANRISFKNITNAQEIKEIKSIAPLVSEAKVLMQKIFDYAQAKEKKEVVAVNSVLNEAKLFLAQQYHREHIAKKLSIIPAPEELAVAADPLLLRNMLIEYCLNADKAGAENITITTRRDDSDAVIEIRDTGEGIPGRLFEKGKLPDRYRMFDIDATTREVGGGSGLAFSWWFINDCGGTIEVQSEFGEGTTFIIRLPTDQTQAQAAGREKIERAAAAIRSISHGNWFDSIHSLYVACLAIRNILRELEEFNDRDRHNLKLLLEPIKEDIAQIDSVIKDIRAKTRESSRKDELTITDAEGYISKLQEMMQALQPNKSKIEAISHRFEPPYQGGEFYKQPISDSFKNALTHVSEAIEGLQSRIELAIAMPCYASHSIIDIIQDIYPDDHFIQRAKYKGVYVTLDNNLTSSVKIRGNRLSLTNALANIRDNTWHFVKKKYDEQGIRGEIIVRLTEEKGYVRIDIIDNGPGIAQELLAIDPTMQRPLIFNLNVSQREGGTGLGLTETWYAIKDVGGTIEVQSEFGKATTFIIRLPLVTSAIAELTSDALLSAIDSIRDKNGGTEGVAVTELAEMLRGEDKVALEEKPHNLIAEDEQPAGPLGPEKDKSGDNPKSSAAGNGEEGKLRANVKKGLDILMDYKSILNKRGLSLLEEVRDCLRDFNAAKAKKLIRRIPTVKNPQLGLFIDVTLPEDIFLTNGRVVIQLNEGCYNQCLICQGNSKRRYGYMPYPLALKLARALAEKSEREHANVAGITPYENNDPLHYRDKAIGADFADVYKEFKKYFNDVTVTTTGWEPKDKVAQSSAEKLAKMIYGIRISYHFFHPEMVRALVDNDEAKINRAYRRLKRRYENVIRTFAKSGSSFIGGKEVLVMNRQTIDWDKRIPGFPEIILRCEEMQEKALREIVDKIREETDGENGIRVDDSSTIQWNFGRARKTLESLGSNPKELPRAVSSIYSGHLVGELRPGEMFSVFRPGGQAEILAEFPMELHSVVKTIYNEGFLWLLMYMRRSIQKKLITGADKFDEAACAVCVSNGFEGFMRYVLPEKYPELYEAIKNIDFSRLETAELEKIYSLFRGIKFPYINLEAFFGNSLKIWKVRKGKKSFVKIKIKEDRKKLEEGKARKSFSINILNRKKTQPEEAIEVLGDLTERWYYKKASAPIITNSVNIAINAAA